jgi:hypothetical protein
MGNAGRNADTDATVPPAEAGAPLREEEAAAEAGGATDADDAEYRYELVAYRSASGGGIGPAGGSAAID